MIKLVNELNEKNFKIVVVNDGSSSKYNTIFESISSIAHVISYERNCGKGYALKQGLKYIKKNYNGNYIVVTLDCDGQHTVKDAKKLCDIAQKNPNAIITGKRIRGKHTPIRSRLGNSITRILYHIATGINIYDTQTGLRAFNSDLIDTLLNISGDRYEYEMNVLLLLPSRDIKIVEVEVEVIYIDNNSGSHFNTITDARRIFKQILSFMLKKDKNI